MNKIEFLEQLERLLLDIPYTERREALNYYTEYFEDAEKDEEEVVKTLGSPEEVAHNIREELAGKELTEIVDASSYNTAGNKGGNATYNEAGNAAYNEAGNATYNEAGNSTYNASGDTTDTDKAAKVAGKKQLEGWQIALIIVGAVVLFPVYSGLIVGAAGTCIGIIAGFFGVILGLMAAGLACAIASVAVLIVAIVKFAISPLASLFLIGLSICLAGIAMLCTIAGWKSITVLVPAIFKGIAYIWNSVFHRKEGVAA